MCGTRIPFPLLQEGRQYVYGHFLWYRKQRYNRLFLQMAKHQRDDERGNYALSYLLGWYLRADVAWVARAPHEARWRSCDLRWPCGGRACCWRCSPEAIPACCHCKNNILCVYFRKFSLNVFAPLSLVLCTPVLTSWRALWTSNRWNYLLCGVSAMSIDKMKVRTSRGFQETGSYFGRVV